MRHALIVRRLLYRAVLFIPAASAVWALLPVVAADNLNLGSGGYGLLLGMVGTGAVAGAIVIPRLRAKVGSARLVTGAMAATAIATAVIATVSQVVVVGIALLPVGAAWIAVMSSLNSGMQLALPNWVRARGLAYYLVVFQGAQALGAIVWGRSRICRRRPRRCSSPRPSWWPSASWWVCEARCRIRPNSTGPPRTHWPAPQLTFTPDATDGPVMVTVTYRVADESALDFTHAMQGVGRSRRRTGALRWELFRDGSDPTRFVESYLIGTWAEHMRQHQSG